jgi:hypothetical protein
MGSFIVVIQDDLPRLQILESIRHQLSASFSVEVICPIMLEHLDQYEEWALKILNGQHRINNQ